jgi:hypothetical protein
MHQTRQSNCVTVELNSEEVLFLLSCIETSERQDLKEFASEKLYVRLVKTYVNIVKDCIDPTATPHQKQNLAN